MAVNELTDEVEEFLFEWVRPRAQLMDVSLEALREGLREMASRGLLGLRADPEFGGRGFSDAAFRRFQETIARCSGALAFVQTQHQSAVSFLNRSANENLKRRFLPQWCTGERMSGIAFSQLRKAGAPVLAARRTEGGWLLNGRMPWFTGYGLFQDCVVAAYTKDMRTWFGLITLDHSDSLTVSPIMRLASMEVGQTVSIDVHEHFVPEEDVLYLKEGNWIHDNDMLNIALQSPFALGCAAAAIDVLRSTYETKRIKAIAQAADVLEQELDRCREEAYSAMEEKGDTTRSLEARAWAIELAARCAHAAITASSGQGNSVNHPAQRVYREALVFTVLAQTKPILEATLERIIRKGNR